MKEEHGERLTNLLLGSNRHINKQLPCRVLTVNSNNTVDVIVIKNDEIENGVACNVPIKHQESQRAFIFLGIAEGDRGVIRFCDNSIENYKINGEENYNYDPRSHSDNDGLFEFGFYPDSEAYVFPTNKNIAIGNKDGSALFSIGNTGAIVMNGANVTIAGGNTTITGTSNTTITGGNVSISGNTKIDNKTFLSHTHTSAAAGNPTSGVN
jgi:hypothetical protein